MAYSLGQGKGKERKQKGGRESQHTPNPQKNWVPLRPPKVWDIKKAPILGPVIFGPPWSATAKT